MPEHGEERNFRQVTRHGKDVEYVTPDGQVAHSGSVCSYTRPVGERYCGWCQEWMPQAGILARVFGCPKCRAEWDRPVVRD
jgi:hypothetical protein